MNFVKPPESLTKSLPPEVTSILENGGWLAILLLILLIFLLILWAIVSQVLKMFSGGKKEKVEKESLMILLEKLPSASRTSGERILMVEGVPVRLRLVVLAPAGRAFEVNPDAINRILDKVYPGLGMIAEEDEPEVRIWPFQLSYEGFANTFQKNTPIPRGEDERLTRWIFVSGRAHIGKTQILLGLGLQTKKPTSVGRLKVDMQEWGTVLRIKESENE
jgi:hypothetical protein